MLGLSESEIFREIENGVFGIPYSSVIIKDQSELNPNDILRKLASGVAKAIEVNNRAIEKQLRSG